MLNSPKFKEKLTNVQWLIVDEIHALAENKRGVHLNVTVERLQRLSPGMTRVGLSATIAPLEEIARYLVGYAGDAERDCGIVDVQFLKQMDLQVISPVKGLVETDYMLKHRKMYDAIHQLVQEHKTTLIFTNTRSATERVVHNLKEMYPASYNERIAAHHGSLSKGARFATEQDLREGKLKVVVSSTSLELGIDIGYVDLVLCLGSPKSVARFLQRAGRAGHQLHSTVKARIIVMDRDDLVECAVLLKQAVEKKIDTIHIPTNALDVLAQQIYGMIIAEQMHKDDLLSLLKQSYCFQTLKKTDFGNVLDYLAGKFISLEERHIYAKIWIDEQTGMIGRKGKMARVIYMTNIGTIPDETRVVVKVGGQVIGFIDEGFLDRLRRGDVFVLGGDKYEFLYSRGMTVQVNASVQRPPTIPSWVSEMLPLSFDLANAIGKFRRLMEDKFVNTKTKEEIISFVHEYLYVDDNAAEAIYEYFATQYYYLAIPHDKKIIIEHYSQQGRHYYIFHALFGRRVNDCLSRAVAFAVGRLEHKDVEIGLTDNGFFIGSGKPINAETAFSILKADKLPLVMVNALDKSEVLRRRFRHCAGRALMILRTYKGRVKNVGRQQMSSQILINSVKQIDPDFFILKEARREVLEDLMDMPNAAKLLGLIEQKKIKVEVVETTIPSPFAFNLVLQGVTDVLKIEDKVEFLRRMHQMVKAKIGKNKEIK